MLCIDSRRSRLVGVAVRVHVLPMVVSCQFFPSPRLVRISLYFRDFSTHLLYWNASFFYVSSTTTLFYSTAYEGRDTMPQFRCTEIANDISWQGRLLDGIHHPYTQCTNESYGDVLSLGRLCKGDKLLCLHHQAERFTAITVWKSLNYLTQLAPRTTFIHSPRRQKFVRETRTIVQHPFLSIVNCTLDARRDEQLYSQNSITCNV